MSGIRQIISQHFYLDTSVWGGAFDNEFEKETILLFNMVKTDNITCLFSEVTENELQNAPKQVVEFFDSISQKRKVEITPEAFFLAKTYVEENVVGQTSFDDCLHIATATVHRADILVSWNFKHIVNVYRVRGYNAINMKMGFPFLSIHSPKEIVAYGKSS